MAEPKSAKLYVVVTLSWALLFGLAIVTSWSSFATSFRQATLEGVLNVGCMVFIGYFWLNGIKDVSYTLWYHFGFKGKAQYLPSQREPSWLPRVVMVYCTCDDFNGESLLASMVQDYTNSYVVILDDSKELANQVRVDLFANSNELQVVRRNEHSHAKAGNLNHYLQQTGEWDFFVILDSDEIVPGNFISRALDYFAAKTEIGIVQANHIATRNRNSFMKRFAMGVDSHWTAYQTVKNRFGFMSLLGHGAMVSRRCYEAAGGFPHRVAEDICLSIHARKAGFNTVFASDIMCEEEFPVDYLAFKKRHNKWTQGNMEFIRNYTRVIVGPGLKWYEKLDIILFTYSLPLTALFSVYVVINIAVLPILNFRIQYPLWMLAPTGLFLLAPMLNDIMFHAGKVRHRTLAVYLYQSTILFGSMFYVSLVASCKSMFGKSVFLVTPKEDRTITFREALKSHKWDLSFAVALSITAIVLDHSILAVALLVYPIYMSLPLIAAHLHEKEKEVTE